jgi:periplasmic protein TonB
VPYQPSGSRIVGIGFVVALHVVIIYALVMTLAHRQVDIPHAPIETTIIAQTLPQPVTPPPAEPHFTPPPTLFIPPPEINLAAPPPVQNTAPVVTMTIKPAAPAATAPPVTITPHIDPQHSRQPDYPPDSRRLGEQGSVVLQVLVGIDGRVTDSKLVTSSGSDRLDQAALQGVKTSYRFIPGTVDGKPQPMWFTFRFVWKLQ